MYDPMIKRDRPKRKYIPLAVKQAVANRQDWLCKCGCGTSIASGKVHWDHEPALRLRDIAPDGLDYIPPQNDPDYIDALCPEAHHAKTRGTGATTAGTDIGKIKKERRRSRKPKFKRPIPARPFQPKGSVKFARKK